MVTVTEVNKKSVSLSHYVIHCNLPRESEMKKITILLVTVFLVAPAGCKRYSGPTRAYTNANYNVGFNPPPGWKEQKSAVKGILAMYMAPEQSDGFVANVNIVAEPLPGAMSSAEYLEKSLPEVKKAADDLEIVERGEIQTDRGTAAKLVYKCKVKGIEIMGQKAYMASGKKGAVVTCTAAAGGFDKYRGKFDQCCKSLWLGE